MSAVWKAPVVFIISGLIFAATAATYAEGTVRYPEAGHGFHCDQRPDYRPGDAKDAWGRALDWFDTHLGVPAR
jgi:carboxymethylenebutenolidase